MYEFEDGKYVKLTELIEWLTEYTDTVVKAERDPEYVNRVIQTLILFGLRD